MRRWNEPQDGQALKWPRPPVARPPMTCLGPAEVALFADPGRIHTFTIPSVAPILVAHDQPAVKLSPIQCMHWRTFFEKSSSGESACMRIA